MSGVGSSGKSGTPPIGHGPSAVTRSKHPREDKKNKKPKKKNPDDIEKEGHDEFAVRVDASLFHLKNGDILEGSVTAIDGENSFHLDSAEGHFSLHGQVNLSIGDKATIRVLKSHINIEGVLIAGAGIQLSMPIPVIITALDIHGGELSHEVKTQNDGAKSSITYSSQKKPSAGVPTPPQEDKAFIVTSSVGSHSSDQIHSPLKKNAPPLAYQDLRTVIEASGSQKNTVIQPLTKPDAKGHDEHPSSTRLLEAYEHEHPELSNDLKLLFKGHNGLVPSGLAFFLAGLVFEDVQALLGFGISNQLADHPAFKSFKADFKALDENINCLANENWRLVVLPHQNGDANRAIKIISNIQTGHNQDGTSVDMRTVVSQLNFVKGLNGSKSLGKLQIEAILMPKSYNIIFRFSRELEPETRIDIEQLTMLYFSKAGIEGHVLFAPLSAGHIDFDEIVNGLKLEAFTPSIST